MRKGFTLVELIVVLVILAVLAAMLIPSLVGYIEKSLEASDILDVRMAYIDVMTAVTEGDTANMDKTVKLKQKQDDWQSGDPITIAGVTHYKKDGNTANWKGVPVAKANARYTMTRQSASFSTGRERAAPAQAALTGKTICTVFWIEQAY